MELKDILAYATPALAFMAIIISLLLLYINRMSRKVSEYKEDKLRLSIEKQISDLANQLVVSDIRFKDVNHLLIDAQRSHGDISQLVAKSDFFKELGIDTNVKIEDDLIFVLTPFHPSYDKLYSEIKNVITDLDFRCMRGDEEYKSSNILAHIIQQIFKARLIVANISGRNPNVYYELGIAHAIGKPVLLVAETIEDVQFDIRSIRVLTFKHYSDLNSKLRNWLVHSLSKSF